MNQWFYTVTGLFGDSQLGPVSGVEIKKLAVDGKLKPATLVSSPTVTNGKWVAVSSIAALAELVKQGENERLRLKAEAAEELESEKKARESTAARLKEIEEAKKRRELETRRTKLQAELDEKEEYYASAATHGRLLLEISKRLALVIQFLWFFFWVTAASLLIFLLNGCTLVVRTP